MGVATDAGGRVAGVRPPAEQGAAPAALLAGVPHHHLRVGHDGRAEDGGPVRLVDTVHLVVDGLHTRGGGGVWGRDVLNHRGGGGVDLADPPPAGQTTAPPKTNQMFFSGKTKF